MRLFGKGSEKAAPFPENAVTADLVVPVLLSDMVLMDAAELRRNYKSLWKTRLDCMEVPLARKEFGEFQRLKLESDGRTAFLSLRSGPLPGDMLEMIGRMTDLSVMGKQPEQAQVDAMRNHKAHAVLSTTTFGDKENPQKAVDKAWQIVELLCTLLEHRKEFVGYVPVSAQVYRPREWLTLMIEERNIDQHKLFMILGNMRLLPGEKEGWMLTLGMEQFGQADLEVWFTDREKVEYYYSLLLDASMYSIAENLLSLGNTFNIEGDPVTYKLVPPKTVENHRWGKFGAMRLEPVSRS